MTQSNATPRGSIDAHSHWAPQAYIDYAAQRSVSDAFVSAANALGVNVGPDRPQSLAQLLPSKADVWDEIVRKHNLRPIGIAALLGESHFVTDFLFAHGMESTPPPAFISTIKLRKAGFTAVCDTEDMFRYWLSSFIDRRIIPPRG